MDVWMHLSAEEAESKIWKLAKPLSMEIKKFICILTGNTT
jgi:hypothetical protein